MATRTRGLSLGSTDSAPDLFGELREQDAARRADFESTRRPIRQYAELIPEPGFGVLDFERFPYLLEPFYSDEVAQAGEVVYVKSTQVGASTGLWRWGVREADQYGRTCIYTFPTDLHVREFGDERIEPAIEQSEYLRARIPAHFVHTKSLKRIGRGWVYFRGSKSRAGAQSTSGQSIVFDEYDELEQSNVAQFERRLSGAKQTGKPPRLRRAGIPASGPGGPIDRAWKASDQRKWIVECPSCGTRQPMVWRLNMRWTQQGEEFEGQVFRAGHDVPDLAYEDRDLVGSAWRACKDCDAVLEGAPILGGTWEAQRPGRPVIGFHIQRLIVADADLVQMVKASRRTAPYELEAFHANDLGEPFSPAEAALTEEDILRASSMGLEPWANHDGISELTMGVDVASERNLNYRIDLQLPDGRRQAVAMGEARNFNEIVDLIERFRVSVVVIDSMPERRLGRALAARFPGRVHLAVYTESHFDPRLEPEPLVFDPKKNIVAVNRTMAFDAMMDSVRQLRSLPLKRLPRGYVEQLQAPRRVTEYDDHERSRRVYVTPSGMADDYAHADVYALAASEMWKLRGRVAAQEAKAQQPLSDEELRVQRGVTDELNDVYDPGFRGGGY